MIAVAADFAIRFPAGMNVAFPQSLAFYPAMAFVAEVAFHVVPLGIVGLVWRQRPADRSHAVPLLVFAAVASRAQLSSGSG